MPTVLLVCGVVALALTLNGFSPRRDRFLLIPSFFLSWMTIELAPFAVAGNVVVATTTVAAGGLDERAGWIGLGAFALSTAGLGALIVRARRTTVTVESAFREVELDPGDAAPAFPRSHLLFPFLMRWRPRVEKIRRIVFDEIDRKRLRLDIYRPAGLAAGSRRPGLLYIHGGAWMIGFKERQGVPLCNHLAANGWVVITPDYRLSPRSAFPAHLIDCKTAIAWYRANAEAYGADPDFLCVTGNSAGGHLAALVGLTPNEPEYQSGFEDVDTGVAAAVPFYGVYDLTNRLGSWHKDTVRRFYEPIVMKQRLADAPDAFAKASPIDQVRPDAPPFFVIHGDLDTLAPVADARLFVERLRAASLSPVLYAEMQGSQHAFDIFPSYRTARVIEGVERFLHSVHRMYLEGRSGAGVDEAKLADAVTESPQGR